MARSLNELRETVVIQPEDCLDNVNSSSFASLSTLSTYLTEEYWSDNSTYYRKWNLSDIGINAKYGEITYSLGSNWYDSDGINSNHATLTRYAFQYLENITGINFTETSDGSSADIAFGNENSGAFAGLNTGDYYISDPDQVYIDTAYVNITPNWYSSSPTDNDYLYQTILHEIGHVLGLGHQSNYNGSASFPTDADFGNDCWSVSMMSYFSQSENTSIDAS
ncbi:MAG: matrixin family metalloprotease, partial [Sulfitobacter sp.]|nr:matrixin family metalloprotease [Sulfitobacter sp.]